MPYFTMRRFISRRIVAVSFAPVGGGVDYRLSRRFAIRALDAAWLRTQLPNGTNNQQNNLRLGAAFVILFGRKK